MKYNINIYYMESGEFFENYFVFIILAIVIFVAILVGASVLGLNFKKKTIKHLQKKYLLPQEFNNYIKF